MMNEKGQEDHVEQSQTSPTTSDKREGELNEKQGHRSHFHEHNTSGGDNGERENLILTHDEARAERKLLAKLDVVILPFTALLYLSAYLDRGNIGNARLQGLESTLLHGSDNKYSVVLTMFFVTYIVFSIPGTLLAKAWLPSRSIALGALIWSIAASGMAGAQNYAAIIVCRLFIGVGEALFGQAIALYYSMWYRKDEVAKRLGLFIGAGVLAGAFGGLIAYGVSHIQHSINTWRILFLIEGLPSFLLAIVVFFFLPSLPVKSRYLTESERDIEMKRLRADGLDEGTTGVDWNGVKWSLTDPKMWITSILYSCMNLTLGSVSGFLPTIIKSLGYSNANAQLYTVPPYAVALVFMTSICAISDRLKSRGISVAIVFTISSIGWIILLTVVHNEHARYFATFCVVIGGYAAIPLIMAWVSNNCPSQSQRATALGMLNSIGQCLSILAAFIFPSNEGPRWRKGFGVNLAFNLMAILIASGLTVYFRWENRKRDRNEDEASIGVEGISEKVDYGELYDKHPAFRYTP